MQLGKFQSRKAFGDIFCFQVEWIEIPKCLQFLKITHKVALYVLSRQKFIKYAKNGQFWRVFENLNLAVKQCYQTGHFKQHKNQWKMSKLKTSNATFLASKFKLLTRTKNRQNDTNIYMRHFFLFQNTVRLKIS